MADHLRVPLHGRNHLPGGEDPIPGLSVGLPWFFSSKFVDFASATTIYLPIDTSNAFTSDSSVFGTTTGAGGQDTVELLAEGIYRGYVMASFTTSGSVAAGSAGQAAWTGAGYPIADSLPAPFLVGPITGAKGCDAFSTWIFNIDASTTTAPHTLNAQGAQNSGLNLTSQVVQFWIEQISPTGNANF